VSDDPVWIVDAAQRVGHAATFGVK
jgi:hypothetical protein